MKLFLCCITALNPQEVWAEGPGLEAEGLLVKKAANFVVHTENAGSAKLEVKCVGPSKSISENYLIHVFYLTFIHHSLMSCLRHLKFYLIISQLLIKSY